MTRYAFTGPTGPFPPKGPVAKYVGDIIRELQDAEVFISGCAHGIDTIAAYNAWLQHLTTPHHLFIPGEGRLWHNEDLVTWARALPEFALTPVPGSYMDRNQAMVDALSSEGVLVAFPENSEEVLRSGTWATIRRARKIGAEVRLFPLDTGPDYEEVAS